MVLGGKGKTHTHKDTKNLTRLSLKFDGEIKHVTDKQKLRVQYYQISLQEMLNRLPKGGRLGGGAQLEK